MCDEYSEDVIYITKIIDGLEHALDAETINKLYSNYIAQIKDYNNYINRLLAHRKRSSHYYKTPVPLSVFKYSHLRPVIILKLMKSVKARYFEGLCSADLIYILGNTTSGQLLDLERFIQRKLLRPEYRERFMTLRKDIVSLQEIQEMQKVKEYADDED